MILRLLYVLGLLGLLAASVWSGTARIMGFRHLYAGEKALAAAEMDTAYERLSAAARWHGSESFGYVLIGRVIHLAQSNGIRISALEGMAPDRVAAEGVAAIIRGISINPADALAWFDLAQSYRGYYLARTRMDRLKAMVAAAQEGRDPDPAGRGPEAASVGREDLMVIAATFQARDLEPEFSFYRDYLARLYLDRGLSEEAAVQIREGFALTPQIYAHPWVSDRAFTQALAEPILQGLTDAASNRFVDPLAATLARAEILELLGRTGEAILTYESLRAQGGADVRHESDLRLVRLRQQEGQYASTIPVLERIIAEEPGGSRAVAAFYHLGLAHAKLGNPEKAVEYYRRHLTRKVGGPATLLALAEQLEILGRDNEAENIYEGLIERGDGDERPYQRIIRLLTRRRMSAEAFRYAERYAKEIPDSGSPAEIIRAYGVPQE